MTEEHLSALLAAAEAKKDSEGWFKPAEGRQMTLHAAAQGVSLTVGRIEALRIENGLVKTRTVRGELYVLSLEHVFAGAVEAPASGSRKAGFV
jgi:hypothetical protein